MTRATDPIWMAVIAAEDEHGERAEEFARCTEAASLGAERCRDCEWRAVAGELHIFHTINRRFERGRGTKLHQPEPPNKAVASTCPLCNRARRCITGLQIRKWRLTYLPRSDPTSGLLLRRACSGWLDPCYSRRNDMFRWAITFAVIALIAALLGFGVNCRAFHRIFAEILLRDRVVLFIIAFVFGHPGAVYPCPEVRLFAASRCARFAPAGLR